MANKIIRVVVGIVIAIGLLIGIYFILPGQYKWPITEAIQESTNDQYLNMINTYKAAKVPNTDVTFDQLLTTNCSNPAWHVEKVVEGVSYQVIATGYKVDVQYVKELDPNSSIHYTNTSMKIVFDVTVKEDGSFKTNGYSVAYGDAVQDDYGKKASLAKLAENVE